MTHFALYPLHSLLSVTAEYSGWHPAQRHWEIHKGESSLIPGSPLRTALISRRLWLVGLCLICFIPLPLCRKKRLPACAAIWLWGAPNTHRQTHKNSKKQTHKDIHSGRFFLPFGDTAGGLRDTVSYTSRQLHTRKHTRELQCSKPKKGSTSVERVQLLIFHYCIPRTLFTFT